MLITINATTGKGNRSGIPTVDKCMIARDLFDSLIEEAAKQALEDIRIPVNK
jgi:hypothetical protein|tara:strand:+ start:583 stop:738 length:156 start_codon:yes stop_codon:yes gene_type:complete